MDVFEKLYIRNNMEKYGNILEIYGNSMEVFRKVIEIIWNNIDISRLKYGNCVEILWKFTHHNCAIISCVQLPCLLKKEDGQQNTSHNELRNIYLNFNL
jgi:hypothetical protein